MEHREPKKMLTRSSRINRIVYGFLVSAGIIFLFLRDWPTAFIMMGTSLAADPFNQDIKWASRPLWQKIWTIIHLLLVFSLLTITIVARK